MDGLVRRGGQPGERFCLYVDRAVLREISGFQDDDAAKEDFCAAFNAAADPTRPWHRQLCAARRATLPSADDNWPAVAGLAMTVLAVTDQPLGAAHGVYPRQNELLGRPPEPAAPPGYTDDVPALWNAWNRWLLGPGARYGTPTARTHPHWTYQGWARSQALVRFRDRLIIEDFFVDCGLRVGHALEAAALLDHFLLWLRYRGARATDLLDRLDYEAARAVAEDVLRDESLRWTGSPRLTRSGHGAEVRGILTYDGWTRSLGVAAAIDDRLWGIEVDVGGGESCTPDQYTPYLRFVADVDDQRLLRDGEVRDVASDVRLRVGGEPGYVFQDNPELGLLAQVRGPSMVAGCRLLVRNADLSQVREALARAQITARDLTTTFEGWAWLEVKDRAPASLELAVLGLAPLTPPRPAAPAMVGGLQVGASLYLCGGEPDVRLPEPAVVLVDRVLVSGDTDMVPLAPLALDPGAHQVTTGSSTLNFRTQGRIRVAAERGPFGWRLVPSPAGLRVAGECSTDHRGLSGALVDDGMQEETHVPTLRMGTDLEYLAVCESGALLQVWPSPARWVAQAALDTSQIDVMQALRTLPSRPVAFLTRSPRSGRVKAVAVPKSVELLPGHVRQQERPDLVAHVFIGSEWSWVGGEPPGRSELFSRSLNWLRNQGNGRPSVRGHIIQTPGVRVDLRPDYLANPFDDVLRWLSERETGSASLVAFRDTWAWACGACGMPRLAWSWRSALHRLGLLGHLEHDFARQRAAVAAAALVQLPTANGLHVLCGSRPGALLERLDDPDDPDPMVGEAASSLTLHRRTPMRDGAPAGPTVVFVEWDQACRDEVAAGLTALGASLGGAPVLSVVSSLDDELGRAIELTFAPGRVVDGQTWPARGGPEWRPRHADSAPGLYRYPLSWGDVFGWRAAADGPLKRVDRYVGAWADERLHGRKSRVARQILTNRLLVDVETPLPPLLARGLVLRSGLPPWRARDVVTDDRKAPTEYLVYENVSETAALAAAAAVGQSLSSTLFDLQEPLG